MNSFINFLIAMFILFLCNLLIIKIEQRVSKKANYQCEMCSNWNCPAHECNKHRNNY